MLLHADDKSAHLWAAISSFLPILCLIGCVNLQPDHPVPSVPMPDVYRNGDVDFDVRIPDKANTATPSSSRTPPEPASRSDSNTPQSFNFPGLLDRAVAWITNRSSMSLAIESSGPDKRDAKVPDIESTLSMPRTTWWTGFHSAELDRLVSEALANNHDLKAAIARIDQAQAQAGIAAGALAPTLQGVGTGQSNSPAGGPGTRKADTPQDGRSQRLYQLGASASYELDFWGKNRSAEDAALAAAHSSLYDRDAIALTLVSNVVTTYFQYLAANDRITVASRNANNMAAILDIVRRRGRGGQGTEIEVQQQATAFALAVAAIPPLKLLREQQRDELATLVGMPPEELELTGTTQDSLILPEAPPAMPSLLLQYRPDIRKAEADLISANANVGVARAQLLPSFNLAGQGGVASFATSALMAPASFYYLIAANVTTTLFDNGKSYSQIDLSKAVYRERVETYRQTILNALHDVEDALAATRLTAEQETADIEASARANEAYDLIRKAFQSGITNYLTILDIERTQYQAEDARVQARLGRLTAAAALFRSLDN